MTKGSCPPPADCMKVIDEGGTYPQLQTPWRKRFMRMNHVLGGVFLAMALLGNAEAQVKQLVFTSNEEQKQASVLER